MHKSRSHDMPAKAHASCMHADLSMLLGISGWRLLCMLCQHAMHHGCSATLLRKANKVDGECRKEQCMEG